MKNTIWIYILLSGLFSTQLYGFEDAFDNAQPMSDKEIFESNNYYHSGRNQRISQEECEKMNQRLKNGEAGAKIHGELAGCDETSVDAVGQSFGGSFGENLEKMMPMVSKAYATVIGMPGMSKINAKISQAKSEKNAQKVYDKNPGSDKVQDKVALNKDGNQYFETSDKNIVQGQDGKYYEMGKDGNLSAADPNKTKDLQRTKEMKEKEKKYEDWCSKVSIATELVSGVTQALGDKQIENTQINPADVQKESLYSLKRTHMNRKKAATIQTVGWGATSACYIGYVAFAQGAARDWKIYLKLAASGFLAYFYGVKIKKHQAYADQIDGLIAELPKVGECNPHSKTHCFCAEETSAQVDPTNFQRYCMPSALAGRESPYDAAVCVDGNMNVDNECKCRKTRSCITDRMTMDAPTLSLGQNYGSNTAKGLAAISNGSLGNANMGLANAGKYVARAKELLKQKAKGNPELAGKIDKTVAKELVNFGLPQNVAAALSSQNGSALEPSLRSSLANDLAPVSELGKIPDDLKNAAKAAYDQGGKGFGKKKKKASATNPFASYLNKGKKSGNAGSGVEVVDYQKIAQEKAEISQNSERPIFDIISHRYRSSAWRKFDLGKQAIETEQ